MHIIPKSGVLVRDPQTLRIVPPEGINVSEGDLFWHRLIADGDFHVSTPNEPEAPKESA
jgi:hypothetical protein